MQMRSFAMLLPCGISLFSGVEFVCCPKHFKSKLGSEDQLILANPISLAADEIRVKKTDIPVMPPAQLASNAAQDELSSVNEEDESNDSNYSKDGNEDELDDEDDLIADDEEDEMVADEAAAAGGTGAGSETNSGALDDINAEYDSGEDSDNYEEDGAGSDSEVAGIADAWDQNGSSSGAKPPMPVLKSPSMTMSMSMSASSSLPSSSSSPASVPSAVGEKPLASQKPELATTTPQLSAAAAAAAAAASASAAAAASSAAAAAAVAGVAVGAPPSTAQPTSDPYFTHFDPHYEHQSYKVSQKVSVIVEGAGLFIQEKTKHILNKGSPTAP